MSTSNNFPNPAEPLFPVGGWRKAVPPKSSTSKIVPRYDGSTSATSVPGSREQDATSGIVVTDNGGAVITHVKVQVIHWGYHPVLGQFENAASSIVSGVYMDDLAQYRGIQRGSVVGSTVVTTPVGNSPGNPPNPFTEDNVQNLLSDLIFHGLVPSPSDQQMFYCVLMPPGVNYTDEAVTGEHSHYTYYAFPLYWANVRWGWVLNGTLDDLTVRFSHELVEACTDPDSTLDGGSTFVVTSGCPAGSRSCEIADVCFPLTNTLNGIKVSQYYSASPGVCVGGPASSTISLVTLSSRFGCEPSRPVIIFR
jgi:hypothetical protein